MVKVKVKITVIGVPTVFKYGRWVAPIPLV